MLAWTFIYYYGDSVAFASVLRSPSHSLAPLTLYLRVHCHMAMGVEPDIVFVTVQYLFHSDHSEKGQVEQGKKSALLCSWPRAGLLRHTHK